LSKHPIWNKYRSRDCTYTVDHECDSMQKPM